MPLAAAPVCAEHEAQMNQFSFQFSTDYAGGKPAGPNWQDIKADQPRDRVTEAERLQMRRAAKSFGRRTAPPG